MDEQDRFNRLRRRLVGGSRRAIAPFCLGLIGALLIVLVQFFRELVHTVADFGEMAGSDVILAVLKLVDLVFIANLVVMLIGASVELFIPRPPAVENGTSDGLGIVDFADLKLKVFASISVIAA